MRLSDSARSNSGSRVDAACVMALNCVRNGSVSSPRNFAFGRMAASAPVSVLNASSASASERPSTKAPEDSPFQSSGAARSCRHSSAQEACARSGPVSVLIRSGELLRQPRVPLAAARAIRSRRPA
jgi:hypothetical protein